MLGVGWDSPTGWRQVHLLPPELSGLLEAADPAAREAAWKTFVETHSRLLLHTARALGRDYDATMDAYAYLLEQLRRDDFHRLQAYISDGRTKFTTWLVVVARRLCLDRVRQRYGRPHGTGPKSNETHGVRRRLVDLFAEELDASDLADPANANPETQLQARELGRALMAALGGDVPDSHATVAFGINAHRDIVGGYYDALGQTHGFLLSREKRDEE